MAWQVQSLVTQVAQLQLLSAIPTNILEASSQQKLSIPPSHILKVLWPDPFTGDRLELDTYLTHCQHVSFTQLSLFSTGLN